MRVCLCPTLLVWTLSGEDSKDWGCLRSGTWLIWRFLHSQVWFPECGALKAVSSWTIDEPLHGLSKWFGFLPVCVWKGTFRKLLPRKDLGSGRSGTDLISAGTQHHSCHMLLADEFTSFLGSGAGHRPSVLESVSKDKANPHCPSCPYRRLKSDEG